MTNDQGPKMLEQKLSRNSVLFPLPVRNEWEEDSGEGNSKTNRN